MNLAQFYRVVYTGTADGGGVPVQSVFPHATGSVQDSSVCLKLQCISKNIIFAAC